MKKAITIFAIFAVAILASCGSDVKSDCKGECKTDSTAVETEEVEEAPVEPTADTTTAPVEDSAEVK